MYIFLTVPFSLLLLAEDVCRGRLRMAEAARHLIILLVNI